MDEENRNTAFIAVCIILLVLATALAIYFGLLARSTFSTKLIVSPPYTTPTPAPTVTITPTIDYPYLLVENSLSKTIEIFGLISPYLAPSAYGSISFPVTTPASSTSLLTSPTGTILYLLVSTGFYAIDISGSVPITGNLFALTTPAVAMKISSSGLLGFVVGGNTVTVCNLFSNTVLHTYVVTGASFTDCVLNDTETNLFAIDNANNVLYNFNVVNYTYASAGTSSVVGSHFLKSLFNSSVIVVVGTTVMGQYNTSTSTWSGSTCTLHGTCQGIAQSDDLQSLYLTNSTSNTLDVYSVSLFSYVNQVAVGHFPVSVVVDGPLGLYVSNLTDNTVTSIIFNGSTPTATLTFSSAGTGASGMVLAY